MTPQPRDDWPGGSFLGMLPVKERETLLSRGTGVKFADKDIVVLQGEVGDYLYVLTQGMVKVMVAAESGAETALAVRSRGDLVGEFALMDDKPRTATARATGPVAAVRVSRASWDTLIGDSPVLRDALTRYLLAKIRASTERRAAERVWDAKERLVQVLYDLAEAYGEREPDGAIRVPITQGELGQLAGVAVSTVERELTALRNRGFITTRYRSIAVNDLGQLGALRFPDKTDQNPLPEGLAARPVGYVLDRRSCSLRRDSQAAIGQGWWPVAAFF